MYVFLRPRRSQNSPNTIEEQVQQLENPSLSNHESNAPFCPCEWMGAYVCSSFIAMVMWEQVCFIFPLTLQKPLCSGRKEFQLHRLGALAGLSWILSCPRSAKQSLRIWKIESAVTCVAFSSKPCNNFFSPIPHSHKSSSTLPYPPINTRSVGKVLSSRTPTRYCRTLELLPLAAYTEMLPMSQREEYRRNVMSRTLQRFHLDKWNNRHRRT